MVIVNHSREDGKTPRVTIVTGLPERRLTKSEVKVLRFKKRWESNIKKLQDQLEHQTRLAEALELEPSVIESMSERTRFIIKLANVKFKDKLVAYEGNIRRVKHSQ